MRHKPKIRTEGSKIIVANFRSGLFMFQTQKAEQYDKPIVAAPATLNGPVLSAVFEISRFSIDSYGSATTNLLHTHTHTQLAAFCSRRNVCAYHTELDKIVSNEEEDDKITTINCNGSYNLDPC